MRRKRPMLEFGPGIAFVASVGLVPWEGWANGRTELKVALIQSLIQSSLAIGAWMSRSPRQTPSKDPLSLPPAKS